MNISSNGEDRSKKLLSDETGCMDITIMGE
jgi:hypothetical protein